MGGSRPALTERGTFTHPAHRFSGCSYKPNKKSGRNIKQL
jgi:hypothetical protein